MQRRSRRWLLSPLAGTVAPIWGGDCFLGLTLRFGFSHVGEIPIRDPLDSEYTLFGYAGLPSRSQVMIDLGLDFGDNVISSIFANGVFLAGDDSPSLSNQLVKFPLIGPVLLRLMMFPKLKFGLKSGLKSGLKTMTVEYTEI